MNKTMLDIFTAIYEKQDVLSKLTAKESLDEFGYSEIHCLDCIGKMEDANVTKVAKALNMTRGAISKITKKQIKKGVIATYTKENNKKEIYFSLTNTGQQLFIEHQKRHEQWIKRDQQFLDTCNSQDLQIVEKFLNTFDQYLYSQIEDITNKGEYYVSRYNIKNNTKND